MEDWSTSPEKVETFITPGNPTEPDPDEEFGKLLENVKGFIGVNKRNGLNVVLMTQNNL